MKHLYFILYTLLPFTIHAELVKGKTIGYKAMGTDAVVEFSDSARVYPFEPAYGKWRLVMWTGFVDEVKLKGDSVEKNLWLEDSYDLTARTQTLATFKATFVDGPYKGSYPGKKKIALYLYIPDDAIMEETKPEPRLEKILKAKKKKQWDLFQQYKDELGFVSVELIQPYKLHFIYDERSPESRNDFRLLILTDTARQVMAYANDGYRKIDYKSSSEIPLDRTLIMYFTVKLDEEERKRIRQAFIDAYQYRD
ncbi:MAG TPA: hypothetical protein VEC12_06460 [Bacteroidia bacterium]|nr:hypothetical protein [Bacteroidia bacterium]